MPPVPYKLQLDAALPVACLDAAERKGAPRHALPAVHAAPLLDARSAVFAQQERLQRRVHGFGGAEGDLGVVARVQQRDVQRRGGARGSGDQGGQAGERGPAVDDAGGEEGGDLGVVFQRREHGDEALYAVRLEELGQVREGRGEDDGGEAVRLRRLRGAHQVRGEQGRGRVREVERCGGRDGGA